MDDNFIKKYYINLDYVKQKSNKHESISTITKNIKLESKKLFDRLIETKINILKNLSLFQSVCHHAAVPLYIANYLDYYVVNMNKSHEFTSEKDKKEDVWTLMLTLLNFCAKQEIQYFLETSLIKNSSADNNLYREYKSLLSHQTFEIILLEASDLHAVIYNLKTSENCRYLNRIWVAQSIQCNFSWFNNKYLKNFSDIIRIFKSTQELLTPPTFYKINVTSIWSEDITAAKNLAESLDRNIVLINTLDFYDGLVNMPYVEIFKVSLHKHLELDENQHIINTIKPISSSKVQSERANSLYNLLFYDGTWQKPVNNNYWSLSKKTLIADATSDDIARCVVSAKKGFKMWSTWSTESRMQVLSKFASALEYNGKVKLSKIVFKWLKFPHWYKSMWVPQVVSTTLLVRTRKPKGIITLMEKDEMKLFCKLTQSLIIGNSVIVICTSQSCNLVPYCDMFSTSGIPPGVINMLSFENVKSLSDPYEASKLTEVYHQFTTSKQIVTMSFDESLKNFNVLDV